MARERQTYASARPSTAEEGGGKFTIPPNVECTITDAIWTEWREAGESALKGGRAADDPALKLTVDIKGMEEPMTEFLGAGKAARLIPSRDGEHLEPPDGSTAQFISKDCNADVFLASICDVKLHKKMAFDEAQIDEPGISSIVGLKFISGRKMVERNMDDDSTQKKGKQRTSLIATEIVALPKGGGGSSKSSGRSRDAEDEPTRGRARDDDDDKGKGKGDDGAVDIEEAAEKALVAILELPKYSKGIDKDKAFAAVFNIVKGEKDAKLIAAQVEDTDWLEGKRRPWEVDRDGMITKP